MKNAPFDRSDAIFSPAAILPVILSLLLTTGCTDTDRDSFQGYIEGDYLHVASPIGGHLEKLSVSRGNRVEAGDHLFTLDSTVESAAVAEAMQKLRQAENRLEDLTKGLRPSEIRSIEAQLTQARAAYELAETEYDRRTKLLEQNAIAKDRVDQIKAELEQSEAAVDRFKAELETARLGAREDVIEAAGAEVQAARQGLVQAEWRLEQKSLTAPQNGLVFDSFYVTGEYVPASHPVVSLLPPGNVLVRFFIPEPVIGSLAPGQRISFDFDGAAKRYPAIISFISPRAEYTPPVIYSRKSRAKLVYMVEARPAQEDAAALHPGQPVDIYLDSPDG